MTKQYEYVAVADGIGIVRFDYGIEDHAIFRDVNKPENLHHVKINYNGNSYFNYRGRRFYLNDFIRTNL